MKFFFVILLFYAHHSYAQSVKTDTAFLFEAKKNAISLYENQMRGQSPLINGGQYNKVQRLHNDLTHQEDSHPYYLFEWVEGTVLYAGEWYNSSFLYDLSQDNLIMLSAHLQKQLLLVKERVDKFTLGKCLFVNLSGMQSLEGGFYEVAYDGHTKVYIRKRKNLERVVGYDVEIPFKYVSKNTYYIKKGDRYHLVKNKRSVLKVLSGHESELKEFIRSQHQSFKDNRAYFISGMARLYDESQTEE
jgi:hypothetical protein